MAGVRQHVLPNFLLKGFASRAGGKSVFSWVFRKDRPPFEANTKDISVENHAYDGASGHSADPAITEAENKFAPVIVALRESKVVGQIQESIVLEFIAHMISRTKHLRDSLRESGDYLVAQLASQFYDEDNLIAVINNHTDISRTKLRNKLSNVPMSQREKERKITSIQLQFIAENKDKLIDMITGSVIAFQSSSPEIVKNAQIEALAKNATPVQWLEWLKKYNWFALNLTDPLILGDVGCVFESLSEKKITSLPIHKNNTCNIYLPLAAKQLIVGSLEPHCPNVDTKTLNEKMAKICREFFICATSDPTTNQLRAFIGSEDTIFSKEQLHDMAGKAISRFHS